MPICGLIMREPYASTSKSVLTDLCANVPAALWAGLALACAGIREPTHGHVLAQTSEMMGT